MSYLTRVLRRTFSTTPSRQSVTVRKIADDLYKERDLKFLVQKFMKSCEHDRFRNRNGIYEMIVHRLATAGRFKWIEEILEDQKKYIDFFYKEGFAARLIHLYGKCGMFEQAYKVFDEMPKRGLLSFNALMGACVNAKKYDKLNGFFRELPKKLSIQPDLVSYNTVIKAFCEMGSFDSASLMLDEMQKKGVEPDLITFNTLLYEFFKNGKFVDGEKIWGKMMEKNVEPDIRSYNAKLLGLVSEKRMEEALNIVEEMRTRGVKLDVFTFNYMIRGFINEGKLEEAKEWYGQIAKNGCAPDKQTFAMLVPFLCEKGDSRFAIEVCKDIFAKKKLVGAESLQRVVDELVKASMIEDAKQLVELGKTNNFCRYKLKISVE
ncbi:hypothetical protein DITRI_Ditri02bG0021500 [Diplodiscus trichospermus]